MNGGLRGVKTDSRGPSCGVMCWESGRTLSRPTQNHRNVCLSGSAKALSATAQTASSNVVCLPTATTGAEPRLALPRDPLYVLCQKHHKATGTSNKPRTTTAAPNPNSGS
ncbi:hypothetical protein FH972_024011 [Carpinus fangiana]|uniref:Uncharacterized protein n=1 Tax=Carpinus fangiana TaxID=176857 RepID=A0A5N6KXH5_9ROSI|nr:hypothetical protein FH972_024011 [Carpinus fangiana]